MELLHWQSSTTIDYATTTYWYTLDGAESNGHVLPEKVRKKVGQITRQETIAQTVLTYGDLTTRLYDLERLAPPPLPSERSGNFTLTFY